MNPALFRVILPVSDLGRAVRFYEDVLGVEGERVSAGRHYFDCGGTILACFDPRADGDERDAAPNPEHVYFSVEDPEACRLRCRDAGARQVDDAVESRPWGERSFYAVDPFGNRICFVERGTEFRGSRGSAAQGRNRTPSTTFRSGTSPNPKRTSTL